MKKALWLAGMMLSSGALAAPGNFKGTISMYVQEYTPNWPGVDKPLKAFQQIADEYQKRYPGIKISFWTKPIPDNNQNIRIKAAAGELFDVYWAQTADLNSTLPRGVAADLAPYFKQPNPYIAGNKAWQDVMNPQTLAESRTPAGAIYTLSADQVAYTIYYNKDLLKKAGVAKAPTTWAELLAAARKLRAAGISVANEVPAYPWWSSHFLSDLYSKDYAKLTGYDGAPGQSPLDVAVAINKGLLTPKDPRFMSWWPTLKQFTDTWNRDYINADLGKNYDLYQDFAGGKAAMFYEGSYLTRWLQDAGVKFQLGAFNFPRLGKGDVSGATGTNTANAYSGIGSFQYAVSTQQANKSMTPEKLAAVVDWMRYFGTPKNVQRIIAENGSYVPIWPGTTAKFASNFDTTALSAQIKLPNRAISASTATPNLGWVDMQRVFGLYLAGNITLDQAKAQAQTVLDRASQEYARKNKVDFSKYK